MYGLCRGSGEGAARCACHSPPPHPNPHCRYHWDHHLRIDYNFSEIEFLDKMFGTLYEHPALSVRAAAVQQEAPRLRRKQHKLMEEEEANDGMATAPPTPEALLSDDELFEPSVSPSVALSAARTRIPEKDGRPEETRKTPTSGSNASSPKAKPWS